MDLDALTAARREEWARLDALSRARHLSGADVDELVTRYRAASADLADIKTSAGRTPQGDYVSTLLARTRLRLTGVREHSGALVPRFFLRQLPAALYRVRWMLLAVAVGFLAVTALVAGWIAGDPAAVAALGDRADLEYYAEEEFTSYYSENPAAVFAGTVWTNNAWIAAQCVLFGVTGIWPLMVLVQNAVGIGTAAAVMFAFGRGDVFFSFILPHGLLEITAVLVAAAAGLQIFWAWVAPGPRSRGEALAAAGRSLGTIAIGLVFVLALSGVIEGFVTPAPWPVAVKIAIGAAALGAFLAYMLVVGGRAVRAGEDGDLTEYEAGTSRLVAG
ncbi:stage II sporulation protein M [Microbacterium lushaniae]|uniref:Stage II sporulation protein M n=1 Tax=Microbacterium lushaniae TaxID=2614639 RepID=A0A5J6L1Q7_9MICO|nr:stage II sporulation protein M [Microbacterium lushaniae]QEW02493.1 stage II sporulation protein M [Microbacterium lushaniae]